MKKAAMLITWILALGDVTAGELLKFLQSTDKEDTLEIHYTSTGCFHHTDYLLKLKGLEDSAKVTVEVIPLRNKDGTNIPASPTQGITIRLTYYDVQRLGALFEYYDSKSSDGMCTTVDNIRFGRHLADPSAPFVDIIDGSCALIQRLDILSFEEILARADLIKDEATMKDDRP